MKKVLRWLPLILLKSISLCFFIFLSFYLSIGVLTGEIVSDHLKYESYLELIKMLYSEDPRKLVLLFSIFALAISLWSVLVVKAWKCLPIIWKKYFSLCFFTCIFIYLFIFFLADEIFSVQWIRMLYLEDPFKLVLYFSTFAMGVSLWGTLVMKAWRCLSIISKKYVSLCFCIYLSIFLSFMVSNR